MLDRTAEQFDVTPSRLVADGGYGSAEMVGWLVDERGIEPHVNLIDKSERTDGTFSRSDFAFDPERNLYVCPGGKELRKSRRAFSTPREGVAKDGAIRYRAVQHDCDACILKAVQPRLLNDDDWEGFSGPRAHFPPELRKARQQRSDIPGRHAVLGHLFPAAWRQRCGQQVDRLSSNETNIAQRSAPIVVGAAD